MIGAFPRLSAAQDALDAGRYMEAAQLAMTHVRSHPDDARGLGLLGSAAMKMGALGQAEQFLRRALTLAPDSPHALRELAFSLHHQERLDEALDMFRRLEESLPDDPQTAVVIASILDKLGRTDEARQKLETAIDRHPDHINLWLAYGLNLRAAGRTDDSVSAYRRAAGIDPERGDAWWGIASIKRNVLTDEDIAVMEQQAGIAIDVANLAPLHFALGRARHERKEYDKAFQHYSEANRLWAESIGYQPHELSEEVDQAKRLFDRSFFQKAPAGGDPSNEPIFIVSLPRSGSTLLEQMIGSHGEVEPLGELPHIPALLRLVMEKALRRGIAKVPEALRGLSPAERTELGRQYLERAARHKHGDAPRFVDKLPHNWSNLLFIHQILPNARIIDIRRDAVDCAFSNFTHSFSRSHASSFALEHIGRTYVDYVRFMDHLDEAAPGLVHHVRYEELIDQPERELRRILDFVGLPWDESCLRFYESRRNVRTPSAEQVRRPLNREGVGAWKPYEQWLGPLFDVLGPLAGDRAQGA